jgi:glyoxylase-like metal-dependent hydrolase (beta-lactamase superfamily II)
MWIKCSGGITESVFQLTTAVSTHFMILGDAIALVDSGISASRERIEQELKTYLGDEASLDFILLTHAHYDHVGGIPYLRQLYPELEVLGSPLTAEILVDDDKVAEFYEQNRICAEAAKLDMGMEKDDWISSIRIDRIMGDGDAIDLGDDVEVKLIATPGHSDDCVAYFVQPDAALVCGEAGGWYGGRDKVCASFESSYRDYVESLERLSSLEIKALGFPHGGAITGEMVPKYLTSLRQEAEQFRSAVRERISHGEIIEEIVASLLPEWQAQNISPEGPFVSAQEASLAAMVRASAVSDEAVAPEVEELAEDA